MILKKNIALLFLLVNAAFIVLGLTKFFAYHQTIIIDLYKEPEGKLSAVYHWLTNLGGLLAFIVFIGLYRILLHSEEKYWIKLTMIFFLVWKVVLFAFMAMPVAYSLAISGSVVFKVIYGVNIAVNIYVLFSYLFIRNRVIKKYYVSFALLMAVAYFFQYAGAILYDDFSIHWALINVEVLIYIAHMATLFLFTRLYDVKEPVLER